MSGPNYFINPMVLISKGTRESDQQCRAEREYQSFKRLFFLLTSEVHVVKGRCGLLCSSFSFILYSAFAHNSLSEAGSRRDSGINSSLVFPKLLGNIFCYP